MPKLEPGQKLTDGYGVTAGFLDWLQKHKSDHIIDDLNRRIQTGFLTNDDFVKWTGQAVDKLWAEYSRSQFAKQESEEFYEGMIKGAVITAAVGILVVGGGLGAATWLERNQGRLPPPDGQAQQSQQTGAQIQPEKD